MPICPYPTADAAPETEGEERVSESEPGKVPFSAVSTRRMHRVSTAADRERISSSLSGIGLFRRPMSLDRKEMAVSDPSCVQYIKWFGVDSKSCFDIYDPLLFDSNDIGWSCKSFF